MTAFNPYQEWLGIQVSGPPSYYQLLGVKRQDTAEQVRRRATKLIKRLNRIEVGEHERERKQLIDRIKRAASCLMDKQQRESYDQKLAANGLNKEKQRTVKSLRDHSLRRVQSTAPRRRLQTSSNQRAAFVSKDAAQKTHLQSLPKLVMQMRRTSRTS